MTTLLRIIKSILVQVKYRTLIIPICTSTALSKIENLDNSAFSITQYEMTNINLSLMNFKDSMSLFDGFTTYYYGNSNILSGKNERFYYCIVNSVRGIPVIIEITVITLAYLGEKEEIKGAFQSYDVAKKYWENIKDRVKEKYSKKYWLLSLHSKDNIMKLLYYIHIQKLVTKTDQLNGCTIEKVEVSGLIYFKDIAKGDEFIPRAPLILSLY
ncbi:7163_t:CDS:1 [Funneliformis mosseae]|uniref:7163_t:CDS:1 n=1 Tax=Funneliformis mosseae TaxID=27381 RepID=A0A9N9EIT3_FUNMO|nr:7163_t:CDS:1 [Funneliformis mosseae]